MYNWDKSVLGGRKQRQNVNVYHFVRRARSENVWICVEGMTWRVTGN